MICRGTYARAKSHKTANIAFGLVRKAEVRSEVRTE